MPDRIRRTDAFRRADIYSCSGMSLPRAPAVVQAPAVDPKRHPAALSNAIAGAWRPYRLRSYVVGVLAGLFVGGVVAPIATTSLLLMLYLAGLSPGDGVRWWEGVWIAAFAVTFAIVGATAFARWQPQRLRMAAETYIWLATRAEENWARVFGALPVPRKERDMRAVLASIPETPATAGERFGLCIGLLELDRARAAAAEMPQASAIERYHRSSADWLVDFIAGATHSLDPLQLLVAAIDDPGEQLEAAVGVALSQARVAVSEGQDWQLPLAEIRHRLGTAPDSDYRRFVWRPAFRSLLIATAVGVSVFWLAVIVLKPYFPIVAR